MITKHTFCIAEHMLNIVFANQENNNIGLLPSFEPFAVKEDNDGCLVFGDGSKCCQSADDTMFTMYIDDSLKPIAKEQRTRIGIFDTENGKTTVDTTSDGGYQYIIHDIHGNSCSLLQVNADYSIAHCALNGNRDMRKFGLNCALMMMFAFRGSYSQTLLIHASLVRNAGYGYAFIAKSGTGKSTHTSLWLKYIDGSDLMNDDNPIVRVIDGKAFIYGSPWSGKTPCYRNIKAPLGAITKIERSQENRIERLPPVKAFANVLPSCSTIKWDKAVYGNTCQTVIKLIEVLPSVNALHCRPDEEAAKVCHNAIAIKQ